ncbi:O-antigen ligase family protein [uncultured Polaribacter sp.]|uniref:O-antigen ligase family protein n=1 Tax=uncultured Polaribacter sp. TaxID=174711 RepID=UPI0030DD1D9D
MFLNKNSFNALFNGLLMSIILSLIKVYWHILRSIFTSTFELKYFLREGFVENGIFKIHVPYFSMLIVFLIVYVVKIEFLRNKNWNLVLKTSILLLLIVSLFLLSGLMSVFLFVLFCIYLVFKNPCNRSLKIKLFIIIFSIITATFIFIKNMEKLEGVRGAENIFFRVQNLMNSDSYVRIENWKSVTEVISENFFFGVGVDGGITELLKKREPLTEPFVNKHNAHNTLLETMLRYGFFGLVIFCLIIFHLISISIKTMNYYFSWFLIIFLLSSLTESYLQRQIGLIFFVFFSLFFYTANITKITKKLVHK